MKRLLLVLSIFVIASPMVAMSRLSTPVIRQAALQLTKIVPEKATLVRNCNTKNVAIKALCAGAVGATAYYLTNQQNIAQTEAQKNYILKLHDNCFDSLERRLELKKALKQVKNNSEITTVFLILNHHIGAADEGLTLCDQMIEDIKILKSQNKKVVTIVLNQATSAAFELASCSNDIIARRQAKLGHIGTYRYIEVVMNYTYSGIIIIASGLHKISQEEKEIFFNHNPYNVIIEHDIITGKIFTYKTRLLPANSDDILSAVRHEISKPIQEHQNFIQNIINNRSLRPNFKREHFKDWHNAQIFSAQEAFTYGLVDHVVKSDATAEEIIQAYNKGETALQKIAK